MWFRGAGQDPVPDSLPKGVRRAPGHDQAAQPGVHEAADLATGAAAVPRVILAKLAVAAKGELNQRLNNRNVSDALGHIALMRQAQESLKASTIRGQQGRPSPGQRPAPGADRQQHLVRNLCPPRPSRFSDLIEDSMELRPCLLAVGACADDHGLARQPRGAKRPPGCPATAQQLPGHR